ncbi:unnamed protein product [Closterium sp. NIES-54]
MDVWGPARVRGLGHERYFLLVVDDYSRYTTVFPLRSKGDVTETFTLPDSPQQNGIAERRIGMVMDVARTSMMHAAAPHFLWPFAVRYVAHQINLHPRVSRPETSPALLWTGKVGDASAFRVWGSRAFVRDLSADKLSPRAAPCVFLGFPPDAPGWQFYHPTSRRVLSSQDVTFDESVPYYRLFPYRTPSLPPPPLFLVPGPPPVDPLPPQGPAPSGVSQVDAVEPVEATGDSSAAAGAEPGGAGTRGAEPGGAEPGGTESGGAEPGGAEPGGAATEGAPPGGASSCRESLSPQELREWQEAIEGPYSSQWQAAMDAEMASWKSTGTYVDAVPPPGANIVSGMWIFRVKRPPGSPPVFKARYVACGFSQRQGVDYFHTFSPTPKMTTLWVLLHVAAHRDYELHSLDFSTAFLQGSLHEEIWLRRPPGFTGSFPPGTQWSLRRPVYGLRQAPREWHDTLRTTLVALGFAPSTADPSLFLRTDTSVPPFYILVYVDDLVFATADTVGLAYVKSELQKRHTCTDLGELRSYLGLQITRDRACRTITLTQSHMVQQVLQRFDFTYSSPQATPLPTRHSLSALPSDESGESSGPYAELVGCLMYFLARELQQRGQLRLAYVASEANTADVFTKALAPCDHQRCCTQLGLVPVLPHLLTS